MSNPITLNPTLLRMFFPCFAGGIKRTALFDPGSPNCVITTQLALDLGLRSVPTSIKFLNISNEKVPVQAVVLPTLSIGKLELTDVRVLSGLSDAKWKTTIILGLNLLTYLIYTVDRSVGFGDIDIILGSRSAPKGSERTRLNHLLISSGFETEPDPPSEPEIPAEDTAASKATDKTVKPSLVEKLKINLFG